MCGGVFSARVVNRRTHLGAGHSDFRPGVDVDAAVSLTGDGAAHGVGDAHGEGAALLTVPQCQQAVRRLA